jgi:hypothetical protein
MVNYFDRLLEIKEEKKRIVNLGLAVILEPKAKDIKGTHYIYVQGYTPGFNDGDPCVHTSYSYTGEELKEMIEWENGYNSQVVDFLRPHLESINNVEEEGIDLNILDVIELVAEEEYCTDYQVLVIIKDGVVKVEKADYECGY